MMRSKFVVVGPVDGGVQTVGGTERFLHGGERYRVHAEEILSPHGEVRHLAWDPDAPLDERARELDFALADADALVMTSWLALTLEVPVLDEARLSCAPNLKVVAGANDFRFGRWIDFDRATERGILVVDTSRSMTPTVAEFAVGITLALLRDIPAAIEVVRAGGWLAPGDGDRYVFRDLAECRVGLAGYGSINRQYRAYIAPYGSEVAVFDPFVDDSALDADRVVRAASLVALAEGSDILVVAIPPTPSTLRVIDRAVIDALPAGSLFVLVSRMAVVDQEALWRRVGAQELRAAVDVFDPEPPPADAWFRTAANVLPTPHIAGSTRFAHERCFREACVDAVRVVTGEPPRYAATIRDKRLYEGTVADGGRGYEGSGLRTFRG